VLVRQVRTVGGPADVIVPRFAPEPNNVVDSGYAVYPVHWDTPKQPRSPNQPR